MDRHAAQANVQPRSGEFPRRGTIDGERLITVFSQMVEPIGRSLPSSSEVVLHDLSLIPNSIVAVYGDVTGRRIGDPATDLLLEQAEHGFPGDTIGYLTRLSDGRQLTSSTMIIRDITGTPVAALCINTDITSWKVIRGIADMMIGFNVPDAPRAVADADDVLPTGAGLGLRDSTGLPVRDEKFVRDVDELASHLITTAIAEVGVPVEEMKKLHKLEVVRKLKGQGLLQLREAVEMIAESLHVTKFTIYNYLNQLNSE